MLSTDNKLYMKESNNLTSLSHPTLGEAGLSASEQAVYLAGLQHGPATSAQLIAITGMPRPTVMAALRVLIDSTVCDTTRIDGRSLRYSMLPATNLKTSLGKRIRNLDAVMDKLDDLHIGTPDTTSTQEAHGQAAVQDMLELALRCRSRKWQIIAPRANALSFMPAEYTSYFKRVRKERQIESESLWELSSKKDIPLMDVLMRKPRYVPEELGRTIPSLMLAFDDSLLILDMDDNKSPSAVLIHNRSMTKTFQIIFEMAWRSVR
jgi:sugar-specific transcriptional regulator TrmB